MFGMCMNTGQSCNAGSRMLVPNDEMDEAIAVAKATAESASRSATRPPRASPSARWCPRLSSSRSRPSSRRASTRAPPWSPAASVALKASTGATSCKPTVFANVTNDMTIAREEIFGPVIAILGYEP